MFKRDKDKVGPSAGNKAEAADNLEAPPLKPFSRKGSHTPPKKPAAAFRPEIARGPITIPGVSRRIEHGRSESRKLTVGRDICLAGEITSCDKLVVEGRVEVHLSDARVIEIAPSGFFKGSAEVELADVSGRFDGELIARDKLIVRNGGRIKGSIRYGSIVIESGGEISGDMRTLEADDPAAAQDGEKDREKDG
jgi:cytoskeletal protein CcmA (bactofilin family)